MVYQAILYIACFFYLKIELIHAIIRIYQTAKGFIMIDIHSHILPNIDDGSSSIEESIEILKEAKKAGFNGIIATPHYLKPEYNCEKQEKNILINLLKEEIQKENIDIELFTGNEIYIDESIINMINEEKVESLNNSRYLLIELPMNFEMKYLEDLIFNIQNAEYIPIIAHPERYSYVQKEPNKLIDLIREGCIISIKLWKYNWTIWSNDKKHCKNIIKK